MNTGRAQEQASVRHDALEFPNGKIILLARLCEGQHGTVLQLAVPPRTNEAEQQNRRFSRYLIGPLIELARLSKR